MESAILLIAALLLSALLGRWLERPGAWLHGKASAQLRELERRLNRKHRSAGERRIRGIIIVVSGILVALLSGTIVAMLLSAQSYLLEIVLLSFLLPIHRAYHKASVIREQLTAGNITAAQNMLEGTLWRHHARLDAHGATRAACELLAIHYMQRILAPALFYLVAGWSGLFACMAITLMHETLTASSKEFGKPATLLYAVFQFIPSRIAACFWMLAAILHTGAKPQVAAKTIIKDMFAMNIQVANAQKIFSLSPQEMQLSSAGAVLGVSLGGPPSPYTGANWYGGGTPKLLPLHIKQAQYVYVMLHLLLLTFLLFFLL